MYFDVFAPQLYPSMLTTFVEVSFQAYKRQLVHPKIYIHVYTFGWQGNQVQVIDSLSKIEKLSIEKKKGRKMIEAVLGKDTVNSTIWTIGKEDMSVKDRGLINFIRQFILLDF